MRQDALDGAALRLLREALPEGWTYELTYYPDGNLAVRTYGSELAMEHCPEDLSEYAEFRHTIAEAADKCREALG